MESNRCAAYGNGTIDRYARQHAMRMETAQTAYWNDEYCINTHIKQKRWSVMILIVVHLPPGQCIVRSAHINIMQIYVDEFRLHVDFSRRQMER